MASSATLQKKPEPVLLYTTTALNAQVFGAVACIRSSSVANRQKGSAELICTPACLRANRRRRYPPSRTAHHPPRLLFADELPLHKKHQARNLPFCCGLPQALLLLAKDTHLFTKQQRRTDVCNLGKPCSPRSVQAKDHVLVREAENSQPSVERSAEKVHYFLDKLHAFRKKVHRFYWKLHSKSNRRGPQTRISHLQNAPSQTKKSIFCLATCKKLLTFVVR